MAVSLRPPPSPVAPTPLPLRRRPGLSAFTRWRTCCAPVSGQRSSATATATVTAAEMEEIFGSLEGWAEKEMLPLLKQPGSCWQPNDLLPASESPEFLEQVGVLRQRALGIPDEYYVCLVGNMVTEEALPTYHSMLNTFEGVRDKTGVGTNAWARWSRGWSAEENRHGDVLNRYLYLCGRVDMGRVEATVHHLIGAGMVFRAEACPFRGFIYTAFQERATFISHGNTARRAKELGDAMLAKICGAVAADEKRHELAYTKVVEKLFEVDPDRTVRALADMMRGRITMPASLMHDGQDGHLFRHYAAVAQAAGVYTAKDYGDVLEHFVERWGVAALSEGLSGEGRRARDYVCELPSKVRKMAELKSAGGRRRLQPLPFSWLFNRRVDVVL